MAKSIPLKIELHSGQKHVHNNSRKYTILKCGKRWGKTKLALYRLLQKAGDTPNGTCWYVAPTYRQAKQIAWRELLQILPPQLIRRKIETDLYLELWNGCIFQLIGADDEDHLRGVKIHHLTMDEAAYCRPYVWPLLQGQLLGNSASGTADLISSPNKTGVNWFSGLYDDAKKKMDSGDPDWAAFFYTIWDNPTIPIADIKKLEDSTPEDTWNLEYMAEESAFSGVIYSEFEYSRHVKEMSVDDSWMLVRGLDWGISHPTTCVWLYVNKARRIAYVSDEFMKTDFRIMESCSAIKLITGQRKVEWSVLDPSMWKRDKNNPNRVEADEFMRNGVSVGPGDNRDRGYDVTKMFFKRNMLFIHPKCKNLISQLRNLQYGDKVGDDMTDALRYVCLRVHDIMFGGNLFPEEGEQSAPAQRPGVFNLTDHFFKGKPSSKDMAWAYCDSGNGEAA